MYLILCGRITTNNLSCILSSSISISFGTELYVNSGTLNQGVLIAPSKSNSTLSSSTAVILSPPNHSGYVGGFMLELSSCEPPPSINLSNSAIWVTGEVGGVFEFIFGTKVLNELIKAFTCVSVVSVTSSCSSADFNEFIFCTILSENPSNVFTALSLCVVSWLTSLFKSLNWAFTSVTWLWRLIWLACKSVMSDSACVNSPCSPDITASSVSTVVNKALPCTDLGSGLSGSPPLLKAVNWKT